MEVIPYQWRAVLYRMISIKGIRANKHWLIATKVACKARIRSIRVEGGSGRIQT